MTTIDLAAIHTALADQIRAGIATASKWTVTAFPSTSPKPSIEIWPDTDYVDFYGRAGADGTDEVQLLVRVFLSAANAESEWKIAGQLLSSGAGQTSSIVDAIHDDPTLGGVVDEAHAAPARWGPEDNSIDIPVGIRLC